MRPRCSSPIRACWWISGPPGAAPAAWCPEIAGERPDIAVGKVNVDEQPELAAQFGVMSIPTLLVFKGGQAVNKAVGARPKEELLSLLD